MAIIITKNGKNAKKIDKQPFEYENNFSVSGKKALMNYYGEGEV